MQHPDIAHPEILSTYPVCKEYFERCHLVDRAVQAGQLWQGTIPNGAVAWLDRMQICYPVKLKNQVEKLGLQVADWKTECDRLSERVQQMTESFEHASRQYENDLAAWQADSKNHNEWQNEACSIFVEQAEAIDEQQQEIQTLRNQLAAHENPSKVTDIDKLSLIHI